MLTPEQIEELAQDDKLIEIGRKAIEDSLVKGRDSRLCEFLRGNGLVIKEPNGQPSHIIRFGPETGLTIALKAIAAELRKNR